MKPRTFDPTQAGPKCRHCGYYRLEHFGLDDWSDEMQRCPAPLRWGGRHAGDWLMPETHYQVGVQEEPK